MENPPHLSLARAWRAFCAWGSVLGNAVSIFHFGEETNCRVRLAGVWDEARPPQDSASRALVPFLPPQLFQGRAELSPSSRRGARPTLPLLQEAAGPALPFAPGLNLVEGRLGALVWRRQCWDSCLECSLGSQTLSQPRDPTEQVPWKQESETRPCAVTPGRFSGRGGGMQGGAQGPTRR